MILDHVSIPIVLAPLAGETHQLAREMPAGQLARTLADQARAAFLQTTRRLSAAADDSSAAYES